MLEVVDELDLSAFYSAYRQDGHGRPAHEPLSRTASNRSSVALSLLS